VFWLSSTLLALQQEQSRRERIARAEQQLDQLQQQLSGSKARRRKHEDVADRVQAIVDGQGVGRWLVVTIQGTENHRYRQATPGKMAIGARVVDATTGQAPSTRQLVIRYLGYYVSTIPLMLGLIWVAFDPRKQGWHDKLAGTVVVRSKHRVAPVSFGARPAGDS